MQQLLDINNPQELQKWLVPSTQIRRQWAIIVARVKKTGHSVIVTKGGKPQVKVTPVNQKRETKNKPGTIASILELAGTWYGTPLDDDDLWKNIAQIRDIKKPVSL